MRSVTKQEHSTTRKGRQYENDSGRCVQEGHGAVGKGRDVDVEKDRKGNGRNRGLQSQRNQGKSRAMHLELTASARQAAGSTSYGCIKSGVRTGKGSLAMLDRKNQGGRAHMRYAIMGMEAQC